MIKKRLERLEEKVTLKEMFPLVLERLDCGAFKDGQGNIFTVDEKEEEAHKRLIIEIIWA